MCIVRPDFSVFAWIKAENNNRYITGARALQKKSLYPIADAFYPGRKELHLDDVVTG